MELMKRPEVAARMEELTFLLDDSKVAGLLPLGATGVLGHEFVTDGPDDSGLST
jgi:hypothetical protein